MVKLVRVSSVYPNFFLYTCASNMNCRDSKRSDILIVSAVEVEIVILIIVILLKNLIINEKLWFLSFFFISQGF